MTEAPTINEGGGLEKDRLDPTMFRSEIGHVDGKLVPLVKRTSDGKNLFIAATKVKNPRIEEDARANPDFWVWRQDWAGKPHTGAVLIDVYAEDVEGTKIPIGHMDWWLQDDYANGGGNMHGAVIPKEAYEVASEERWGGINPEPTAFKVDPEYQSQGIGSLMLATSSVALISAGITKFYRGALLDPAKSTYARFGLKPEDFPTATLDGAIPIERLAQSPQVEESISDFLQS